MLATYPIEATDQNWISETLLDSVRVMLNALQSGNAPPEFDAALSGNYRDHFLRGPNFKKLYDLLVAKCRVLTNVERAQVLNALSEQNDFPGVFGRTTACSSIKDTFPDVHSAANQLFRHAFEKLSDWRTEGCEQTVRAGYHKLVDAHLSHGGCPFCGYEPLEAFDPDLVDPDLDHYLAISIYPFAGVNLRNLTVMGDKCNRSYKGAQDILLDEHSARVDCFDPYGAEQVSISLHGTTLLSEPGKGPDWAISFDPDIKSLNWRRIFRLETRLKANVLERYYKRWISHFVDYAKKHEFDLTSNNDLIAAVGKFKGICEYDSYPAIGRLKTCFFELVEAALNDPTTVDRMRNFLVKAS